MSSLNKKDIIYISTAADAIKKGYLIRTDLQSLIGSAKLHSFQHWQGNSHIKPKAIYALSEAQLIIVRDTHLGKTEKLENDLKKLKRKLERFRNEAILREAEISNHVVKIGDQEVQLRILQSEIDAAICLTKQAERTASLAQYNMDQMSQNSMEIPMIKELASSTGKSSAQLVVDASPKRTGAPFTSIPTNGMPGHRLHRRRNG